MSEPGDGGSQLHLEKYSRGRRGAPAKGVGREYPAREFKSLLLRQKKSLIFKDFFHFHSSKIPYNPIRTLKPRFFLLVARRNACLFCFRSVEHHFLDNEIFLHYYAVEVVILYAVYVVKKK